MRITLDVIRGRGAPQVLRLDVASVDEARSQAQQLGFQVLAVRDSAVLLPWRVSATAPARINVPVFVEQLHDLLSAGLSVIEALDTLAHGARGRERSVVSSLITQLRNGDRLSDALAGLPVFPALLVALVRASELTSDLPQALARYRDHQKQADELRHRVIAVAIYPALVTFVGGLVLLFLTLYVMPRFARIFDGMNADLPWSARAMVAWSHGVSAYGGWILAAVAGLALAVVASVATPGARARRLQSLLDAAPLRVRMRTYFLARWYRATGLLVEGGIPLPQALQLANNVLPQALQRGGRAVELALREGLSPADAHRQAGMATPVAEQLMRAGERIGDLGAVLTRAAKFHEAEFTRNLERAMRALEPVVMTLVGVGVGVVVVMMYMPIFELAAALQ